MLAFLKSENHRKKLYALPAIALAFPTIPVFVLLPTFYAEEVGLGLAAVGLVLLGLRIIDVLSDPIIGWLTDLIPYKYGRRKLPIVIGGLISAPALLFLLTPSQDNGLMYLALSCGFLYIGWTAIQIPYLAWSSDLYSDFKDRNYINGLREGGKILGILAAGLLLFILLGTEGKSDFRQFTWITIGLGILCFIPTLFWVPEIKAIGSKPSFVFPKENKLFLKVVMAWFVNGLANGLPAVCLPLFMTHVLKVNEQYVYLLIFVYFLFAVLSIPLWLIYAHHRAKHKVWCASMLLTCVAFIFVPFIGEQDILAFGLICAFTGIALGSDLAMPPSIQADCADWDRYKYKVNRTATLFAYWSMATKLALGVAVGIAFPTLELAGLTNDAETIETSAKWVLIVIYAVLPIVLKLCAVRMMWNFPLTRTKHIALTHALEKRS